MSTIDHQAFFIDGGRRPAQTDDRFEIISQRSEQVIRHVPGASRAAIDAAVAPRAGPSTRGSGHG